MAHSSQLDDGSEGLGTVTKQYGTIETQHEAHDESSHAHIVDENDFVTREEEEGLSRGLHQRHISLVALAGSIGTGLFLGLGSSIQAAGPLGALVSYIVVGLIVASVQFALGEVTALLPVTGSFVRHSEFLWDPAVGFAVGWNLVYGNNLSVPAEISAICVLFQFWLPDLTPAVWILVFIVLTFLVGIALVRVFGEVEFWFALLKIFFIIFLIILGIIISAGGIPGVPAVGFKYWSNPGPFVEYRGVPGSWGKFLGFWSVMSNAVFSFAGTESVAMAAAETRNPRQAIPRACKRVFVRVALFYVLSVLVVGLLVSSADERLNDSSGTAAQSPFVIAASAAGIAAIPSVVNAIVITSAFSSSNQALLAGTRVLYALALKKQAPKVFLRTTSWGIPWVCVMVQSAFMSLAFMSLSSSAYTVFNWFINLTAAGVLVSWITILANHHRLLSAMSKQEIPTSLLPWHNKWTRWSTPAALVLCLIILFTSGWENFIDGGFSSQSFISHYLDIPLVLAAYGIWKVLKRTRLARIEDIPLREAFQQIQKYPEEDLPRRALWQRILTCLWD